MFYVVGNGLVGGIFKQYGGYSVVHRNHREAGAGVVNAAALSGKAVCDAAGFDATIEANVALPLELYKSAERSNVPFITFSTGSVYAPSVGIANEMSLLYPANLYVASKILMEQALPSDCFIFRIPQVDLGNGHPNDLGEKVKGWEKCEDRTTSLVHADSIYKAVHHALTRNIEPGIYNIASERVNLVDYIRAKYNWEGEVVPAGSLGLSNIPVLNLTKAQNVGLI